MADELIIAVYHDDETGRPQVAIGTLDADGTADLYRLAGPKMCGTSTSLLSKPLDEADATEIRRYLDAAFPSVRSVTYDLSAPDSRFVLTEALGRYESYEADRARDDRTGECVQRARIAGGLREQAEAVARARTKATDG